ncbi:MAG: carbohydrate deacetylase [Bryobacteraceae bacterium]
MSGRKLLIVNADDFGYTRDVNEGILEAHREGVVTSTTLMANAPAFRDAVRLALANPTLGVGCHLVLVGGGSLAGLTGPLPVSVAGLACALALGRFRPFEEMEAQVNRVLDAGLTPSHLDAHKHTHMLPSVAEAMGRISEQFRIPWVRRPLDVPVLGACLALSFTLHGCRMADHFEGFRQTGRIEASWLSGTIRSLPPGITELMCHPGLLRAELAAAKTRLKESRARELQALTSPLVRTAVQEAGVELVDYRDLSTRSQ